MGIKSTIVSRKKKDGLMTYEELNEEIVKKNTIIINCTPLGTFPKNFKMQGKRPRSDLIK